MKRTNAARSAGKLGAEYGYRQPFFDHTERGSGGQATIEAEEDSGERRTLNVEPERAEKVRPSEHYRELTSDLRKIVKEAEDATVRMEAATQKMHEIQEESRRLRPMPRSAEGSPAMLMRGWRTWEETLTLGKPQSDAEFIARDLNDRAMVRCMLRGYVSLVRKKDASGDENVTFVQDVPDEAIKQLPEYARLARLRAHITMANDVYDTSSAGEGLEWTPTVMSSEMWDYYRIRGDFLAALVTMNVPRGTGSYDIPTYTAEDQARIVGEHATAQSAAINSAAVFTNTTAKATLTPKKHFIIKQFNAEAEEDWAIETIMWGRRMVGNILIAAIEQAVISGQVSGSSLLDDLATTSGLYSADGYDAGSSVNSLRLYTIVGSYGTAITGKVTVKDILDARMRMGKYGAQIRELGCVGSPTAVTGMLYDDDVRTVDQYGTRAVVLTGEIGSAGGMPIVISDQFPEDMAATGKDAGTSTRTGCIVWNREQWVLGIKRAMNIVMTPLPGMDLINIIGSVRSHFVVRDSSSHAADFLFDVDTA